MIVGKPGTGTAKEIHLKIAKNKAKQIFIMVLECEWVTLDREKVTLLFWVVAHIIAKYFFRMPFSLCQLLYMS
jgi:hypothetical protein